MVLATFAATTNEANKPFFHLRFTTFRTSALVIRLPWRVMV